MKQINEIHETMLTNIDDSYQKTEGFPTYDLTRGMAFAVLDVWKKADEIEKKQDVNNMTGDELAKFVSQRKGIIRKEASYATGMLTVTQGSGYIKAGTLFESQGGIQYEAVYSQEVKEGDHITIRCTTAGTTGNIASNVITKIPVTIQGISGVTNDMPMAGGYEEESDDDLRQRYFNELRYPATSGNKNHYRKWALEVEGVGAVKAISLWNGKNTVKVVIINSDRLPADNALVQAVQNYIDPGSHGLGEGQAPVGAYCTVVSASQLTINVTLNAIIVDGVQKSVVQQEITDELTKYLREIAFNQDFVSYAEVGARIINLENVVDYDTLRINGSVDRVTIGAEQVAVLGGVTLG